ncbi:hypothetical protein AX17_003952 [Amanita inopinata Kibby_2008]|nr:hypothetical protein AX17_003952 [Amanita inopinata Kibby_2008]
MNPKNSFRVIVVFASFVSALAATCPVNAPRNVVTFSTATNESTGTAYFMNDGVHGNYIFAADIGTDAKLILRKGYFTGGFGAHGIHEGPDPFFSQGSIHVNEDKRILMIPNAGSNSLTTFRINPTDPSDLKMIGNPVPSGGEYPVSITMNKAGDMACALNGGRINGVSCFKLDLEKGLVPLPGMTRYLNINQTTPPVGPEGSAGQVEFSEDEKYLLVIVKGSTPSSAYVAVWDVYPDGSFSPTFRTISGGFLPWSITNIPGRNAFISADGLVGYDIYDLELLESDPGARATEYVIPKQIAICWSAYSRSTDNYYLAEFGTSSLIEIHVDENLKGSTVANHTANANDGSAELAITSVGGKDYAYNIAPNPTAINVFSLDGPGRATLIQTLYAGAQIRAAGIEMSPDYIAGMAVYRKRQ